MDINLINMSGYEPNTDYKINYSSIIHYGKGKNVFKFGEEGNKKINEIIGNNIGKYLLENKDRLSTTDYLNEYDMKIIKAIGNKSYYIFENDDLSKEHIDGIVGNLNKIIENNIKKRDKGFKNDFDKKIKDIYNSIKTKSLEDLFFSIEEIIGVSEFFDENTSKEEIILYLKKNGNIDTINKIKNIKEGKLLEKIDYDINDYKEYKKIIENINEEDGKKGKNIFQKVEEEIFDNGKLKEGLCKDGSETYYITNYGIFAKRDNINDGNIVYPEEIIYEIYIQKVGNILALCISNSGIDIFNCSYEIDDNYVAYKEELILGDKGKIIVENNIVKKEKTYF